MPRAPSLWLSTVWAATSPASPLSIAWSRPGAVEAPRQGGFGFGDNARDDRAGRSHRVDQIGALPGPHHGGIEILRRRRFGIARLVGCGGLQLVFAAVPRAGEAVGEAAPRKFRRPWAVA